jgi:hypothetical protein
VSGEGDIARSNRLFFNGVEFTGADTISLELMSPAYQRP